MLFPRRFYQILTLIPALMIEKPIIKAFFYPYLFTKTEPKIVAIKLQMFINYTPNNMLMSSPLSFIFVKMLTEKNNKFVIPVHCYKIPNTIPFHMANRHLSPKRASIKPRDSADSSTGILALRYCLSEMNSS